MRISTITKEHVTTHAAKPADYDDQMVEKEARVKIESSQDRNVWVEFEEPGLPTLAISLKREHDGAVRVFLTSHGEGTFLSADWIGEEGEAFMIPPSAAIRISKVTS